MPHPSVRKNQPPVTFPRGFADLTGWAPSMLKYYQGLVLKGRTREMAYPCIGSIEAPRSDLYYKLIATNAQNVLCVGVHIGAY